MAESNVYQRQVVSGVVPNATSGLLADPVKPRDVEGRRRVLYAEVTFVNADAVGASANVALLPLGARVLSASFNVIDALNAGTADLGDSDDANRYIAAAAVNATGGVGSIADTGLGYVIATEAQRTIILTTATGDPVDGDQIDVIMEYVID
ncbi:MAG: hypothetical protein ACR2PR_08740 [Pseudohongiellaceae bacterium]